MCATVSIIVPIYNAEATIEQCIQSIQLQTYKNWKLLLVDDGSTDRSSEICERLTLSDSRINYYRKENGGVSSARNFAMDRIDTPYFVCVDSDDSVEPNYLSELLKAKEIYSHAGHIWCCFQTVDSQDKINSKPFLMSATEKYSIFDRAEVMSLYESWMLQMSWHKLYDTALVNKSHLRMDETLSLSEDLLFNLAYLDISKETKIVVVNLPLYNYTRGSSQSLDHKFRSDMEEICQKSDSAMQYYLDKWEVDESQKQIFYNVRFYKMEKVLRNTFHPNNNISFVKKNRYNNHMLESDDFQNTIKMRTCYVHPVVLWAYKRKKYSIVLFVEWISRIKHVLNKR